jgi:hypothetical protein
MKYILPLLILSLVNLQINCDNASKVVEYAKSKIGCGYIWGSTGQTCTQALINRLAGNGHVDPKIVKKWIGKQVFDCAGLVSRAFQQVGIRMATGATSAWKGTSWQSKGTISNYPKDKVCVLYREGSGRMQHTGIYIGNGEFIHASGSKTGVVKEKMPGKWTHWGIPKGLYSGNDSSQKQDHDKPVPPGSFPFQAKVTASSGGTVNLRKSASTNSSIIIRIKLGETVTVTGEESDWYKITYNSANGYMMKKFLLKA